MDYLQEIAKTPIKIKNKKKIISLIDNYGYYRIIECYGDLLKNLPKRLYNTNNICKIFHIDKELSKILIFYLLDFEQKLNARSIKVIVPILGNQNQNYILNLKDIDLSNIKNQQKFIDELYNSAKGCNCLMMYDDPKKIPLNQLCLSWNFHTIIDFINLQSIEIKKLIAKEFNINIENFTNFISACHSIRKFRNTISHNDIFFITTLNYYRREFNRILKYLKKSSINIEQDINVYSLIEILESFLQVDIKKEIYEVINKTRINKKMKMLILDYMHFS